MVDVSKPPVGLRRILQKGILGTFHGVSTWALGGVEEEAKTRGFAAPAFAGCSFVEVLKQAVRRSTLGSP
jgi:hypothetical protein